MSEDPKGGLATPAVSQSLADAGFAMMSADLANSGGDIYRELKKRGFAPLPVIVLYPAAGPRVGISSGTPESAIVSTVERFNR